MSLAAAGYDVSLVVADRQPSLPPGAEGKVEIVALRRRAGRLGRMVVSTVGVFAAALRQRGQIYHFHDPELIPAGLLLRLLGKRVIYDAHEDLPRDILFRGWIPKPLRPVVSRAASLLEWIAGRTLSGVVAATPTIARRFPADRCALVQNFARLSEFAPADELPHAEREGVAYVGSITRERCAFEMVEAVARVSRPESARLLLAGEMSPASLHAALAASPGWSRVDYRGRLDRAGVRRLLSQSRLGLAVFHPVRSYIESQPIKLFEYMAAGLPVVAADFPGFRDIVERHGCGLCVPSTDVAMIASAIEWIFAHPAEAEDMGRRGRALVLQSFNWEREAEALLALYDRVLGARPVPALGRVCAADSPR
jgi:glycosyltransferase involved in cell wall biosynthesis